MEQRAFGANSKGDAALLYTFTNKNGMMIGVTDLGATLHAVLVPDRDGTRTNMKKELLFLELRWAGARTASVVHHLC